MNTNLTDLHEYLKHLLATTNMKCLTPEKALCGQCGFMAANVYARSIFGEDALANLSIEKPFGKPDAPVTGHIRIRAKSQVGLLCATLVTAATYVVDRFGIDSVIKPQIKISNYM